MDTCECDKELPSSIKCRECSLFPSWSGGTPLLMSQCKPVIGNMVTKCQTCGVMYWI